MGYFFTLFFITRSDSKKGPAFLKTFITKAKGPACLPKDFHYQTSRIDATDCLPDGLSMAKGMVFSTRLSDSPTMSRAFGLPMGSKDRWILLSSLDLWANGERSSVPFLLKLAPPTTIYSPVYIHLPAFLWVG